MSQQNPFFFRLSIKLLIVEKTNYKLGITMELIVQIRNFVIDNYVKPARAKGDKSVIVVSGDVHSRMNLTNSMPAVCNALRSETIWNSNNVRLIREIRRAGVKKDSSTNRFELGI
jgi:hypothetical protein